MFSLFCWGLKGLWDVGALLLLTGRVVFNNFGSFKEIVCFLFRLNLLSYDLLFPGFGLYLDGKLLVLSFFFGLELFFVFYFSKFLQYLLWHILTNVRRVCFNIV